MDLNTDTSMEVAQDLSGGGVSCGTDSISIQHYLLWFEESSAALREMVALFV